MRSRKQRERDDLWQLLMLFPMLLIRMLPIWPKHEQDAWPWCDDCGSWHHPDNPTCKKRGQ